ncbi:MAG TPA: hypothetical protein VJV97_08695 [Gemmatimonadaceae bacterium]|nr:hypothetical protein [Gemmatimonadaceae bacterium]
MSPSQAANAREIGPKLFEAGCRQGALIQAPARMLWLTRSAEEQNWTASEDVVEDARLVVVSQDCDIYASVKNEPRVEAITARWTSNSSELYTARKGNSARLFLLQEREKRGLVADARRRIHLDKTALLGATFEPALNDEASRTRFANWVAGRYNRPAIPNDLVDAIQKPIVSAVDGLVKKDDPLSRVFNRVVEIRFAIASAKPPWTVHLVMMIDEGDELTAEEEAELAGWLDGILVSEDGPIAATAPLFRTEKNISLHDYQSSTRIPLDYFTPEENEAHRS